MEKTKENKFRYNDVAERYLRMNKFYIVTMVVMWCLFLMYIWMKLANKAIAAMTVYGNTVLIIAFLVTNIVTYLKNKGNPKLSKSVLIQLGLEVFLIGAQTDAEFIFYCMIGVLVMQIPFYDLKPLKIASISYELSILS